jgi:hypothetical protein
MRDEKEIQETGQLPAGDSDPAPQGTIWGINHQHDRLTYEMLTFVFLRMTSCYGRRRFSHLPLSRFLGNLSKS